jgi:hypothetical protein
MKLLSFRVFAVIFNTVVSNVSLLQRMTKVVSLRKFGILIRMSKLRYFMDLVIVAHLLCHFCLAIRKCTLIIERLQISCSSISLLMGYF